MAKYRNLALCGQMQACKCTTGLCTKCYLINLPIHVVLAHNTRLVTNEGLWGFGASYFVFDAPHIWGGIGNKKFVDHETFNPFYAN